MTRKSQVFLSSITEQIHGRIKSIIEPRLIQTPCYYGQFALSLGKALTFSLNLYGQPLTL